MNTSVKLAEKEVATPVELLDVFWLHLERLLVEFEDFRLGPLRDFLSALLSVKFAVLTIVRDGLFGHFKCHEYVRSSHIFVTFN